LNKKLFINNIIFFLVREVDSPNSQFLFHADFKKETVQFEIF